MAQLLKIGMNIKDINWEILYREFDSRNGFEEIVFGMDISEDCELLNRLSRELDFDLSFIKYPEGGAFNGSFGDEASLLDEFVSFFQELLLQIEMKPDYFSKIDYRYLNFDYLH